MHMRSTTFRFYKDEVKIQLSGHEALVKPGDHRIQRTSDSMIS